MAYPGSGRGGRGGDDRGDQHPQYGGGGGRGGGGRGSFVWPPPASTPRPTGYRAPMVLPHQAVYGAPAVVYRAPAQAGPPVSFSPAPAASPVTIRPPPSSASPAPAPRQLVQGAPTRAPEPAPVSSAPSAAALAKEVEKRLFVSETALAPPAAAASAAVAAAQGAAASDAEDATDVDLAPVSKKGLAHPARPGLGTVGKKVMIRANHVLVDVADNNLFHYDVAINPESKSRQTNREVLSELIRLHGKTALGGKLPAYDGRKSLYTAGSLPFESEEFVVTLVDPEKKGKERAEREYKITIRIAGRTDLYHLHQFLRGRQRGMPQETIQVLDVVLRESPSWNYVTVSRSFFSTTFGHRGDIGEGLECWRDYYQSLRPTQMGLSLNIDIATSFFKPVTVIKFVEEFLNIRDTSRPLSDRDRVKIKKALRGVRIETSHQQDQIRRYKITGLTPIPMSQLIFPVDDKGTSQTVVQYFLDKYNYRLKYGSWPCLQAGSDSRPVYLPMEVCKIVEGQRYSKKLNDRQVTNILRVTCKRPQEREQSIRDMVLHNNYAEDKFAQEFGIKVCSDLVSVPARVLPPPLLKYNDSGREKTCAPSVGQWNMINKKMINGGTIDNWTCLNFSRMRPEEVQRFCMDLTHMCNATGMNVNPRPFVEVKSAAPNHIENALRDVHRRATQMSAQQGTGSQLQLLIVILPDISGSYGKIKRVCEIIGIVSQCCLPKHASRPNKQYLENVALKVNVKVGGRNTVLERAFVRNGIPFVSEVPTIIFGADVTHTPPGEDSASSIAAVVASMDWPEITKYRGLVSARPHRQEIIEDLFTVSKDPQKGHNVNGGMIRELLIAFRRKTNRRPERIIFYRDGVSEGQFSHILLHEMDAIRKACASLEEGYLPPVTFVVVQKRHHTRLFPEVHGRRDMTDKSGNILPGTVVDQKICHPTEFDFYLCSHAGIQGTSRPTHYHVLYDENHFTADAIQSLTNNLCYTYARCTRAVSVVPPAYYAHLAAFRARYYVEGESSDGGSTPAYYTHLAAFRDSNGQTVAREGRPTSISQLETSGPPTSNDDPTTDKADNISSKEISEGYSDRAVLPEGFINIEVKMLDEQLRLRVEKFSSIEYVAAIAMDMLKVRIPDTYFLGDDGRTVPSGTLLSSSCYLHTRHRTRGGANRVSLMHVIHRLMQQKNWLEYVNIPMALCANNCAEELVDLAPGARWVFRMLGDSLEHAHERKLCYDGLFGLDNIFYDTVSKRLFIEAKPKNISQQGYINDEGVIMGFLKSFCTYEDKNRNLCYPMHVETLIYSINSLEVAGDEYVSKIKSPVGWSSSDRVKIFDVLMLHYHKLPANARAAFKHAIGRGSRTVTTWHSEASSSQGMQKVFTYPAVAQGVQGGQTRRQPAVGQGGQTCRQPAVGQGGQTRQRGKIPKRLMSQKYSDDGYGLLYFSRCFITHIKLTMIVSEKQAEAAIYGVVESQLTNLHHDLLVTYPALLAAAAPPPPGGGGVPVPAGQGTASTSTVVLTYKAASTAAGLSNNFIIPQNDNYTVADIFNFRVTPLFEGESSGCGSSSSSC